MRVDLPRYRHCFICGTENHKGLGASPFLENNSAKIIFTPELAHSSLENTTHGGIQAALLDEVLFWAAAITSQKICVTAEMNLRYLKPVNLDRVIIVSAQATKVTHRIVEVTGKIEDNEGILLTQATAKFFPLKNDIQELLEHTVDREKYDFSKFVMKTTGEEQADVQK